MRPVPVVCGSLSPFPVGTGALMHEAGYRALGLDYAYVPFRLDEDGDLEGALRGIRAMHIRGVGLSMPFKERALNLVDELDPSARAIGAINTVVNDDGKLTGYNTDCIGAVNALAEVIPKLAGSQVLMLGAGGAARAVAYGLLGEGASLRVTNRTRERAERLTAELGGEVVDWGVRAECASASDVVINATSIGMDGSTNPIDLDSVDGGTVVMDIVYKPLRTPLLAQAVSLGLQRVVHGGRMLLHQAARQFELYTGRPAPLPPMNGALDGVLASRDATVTTLEP